MAVSINQPQRKQSWLTPELVLSAVNTGANIFGKIQEGSALERKMAAEKEAQAQAEDYKSDVSKTAVIGLKQRDPGALEAFIKQQGRPPSATEASALFAYVKDKKPANEGGTGQPTVQQQLAQERLNILKKGKPATGDQFKAGNFALRMEQAEQAFTKLTDTGFDPTGFSAEIQKYNPIERWKPELVKQQDQAERNFLNAALRRESGAAISDEERRVGNLQYFPQPGDGPDVLAQKKQNRQTVMAALKAESGPAYAKVQESLGGSGQPQFDAQTEARIAQGMKASGASREEAIQFMVEAGLLPQNSAVAAGGRK